MSWDCLTQNVQCHSLAVGHRMRLPFTKCPMLLTSYWSYQKMWWDCLTQMFNVSHLLLVIEKDVMTLPFTWFAMSLTCCWSWHKCDENSFHKMCQHDTHFLFVIEKMGQDKMWCETALHKILQWISQTVCHRKRCDQNAFHKSLMSLTSCW